VSLLFGVAPLELQREARAAEATVVTGWRDILPVHPAADLLPLLPADELSALAGDIKLNGLNENQEPDSLGERLQQRYSSMAPNGSMRWSWPSSGPKIPGREPTLNLV